MKVNPLIFYSLSRVTIYYLSKGRGFMSPVYPVFHTVVIVRIGIKYKLRVGTSIPMLLSLVGRVAGYFNLFSR